MTTISSLPLKRKEKEKENFWNKVEFSVLKEII